MKVIYHISDIHIKTNPDRDEEYTKVFENLYRVLEEDKEEKLIVICGDFFHEKNFHSNTQEMLAKYFMNNLSKCGEIVIIDGNHDINLANENAVSSVESLLTLLESKNKIHYLKKAEITKIQGINFGLTPMINKGVTPILNKNVDEIYIGLYHGALYGATTDLNYKNDNAKSLKIADFKDYDICMFGDIHKFQYLNSKKTMAYSSSLIQQNFGESIKNHGVIRWNLETLKGEFIEIPNEYAYKKITITDPIKYDIEDIKNKKVNLTIYYKNLKDLQLKQYIEHIKKHCEIIHMSCNELVDDEEIKLNNKTTGENIMTIYKEYLKEKNIAEDTKVTEVLQKYIDKHKNDEVEQIKNIKLLTLDFENLCTYGSKNKINFENLKELNLLCGKNGLGKTSIIDIILFSIYGEFSTGSESDILNKKFEKGYSKITLNLNGSIYRIERDVYETNRNKLKIYKNDKDITGCSLTETKKMIPIIFGTYNEMLMSSVILQIGNNFVEEPKKYDMITKHLGFESYEKIFQDIKTEYSKFKTNKSTKKLTNKDFNKIIYDLTEEEKGEEIEQEKLNKLIEQISNEIFLISSKLDDDIKNNNICSLKKRQIKIRDDIETNNQNIKKYSFYKAELDLESEKNRLIIENEDINDKIHKLYKHIVNIEDVIYDSKTTIKLKETYEKHTEEIKQKENENNELRQELDIEKNVFINYEYIETIQKKYREQQYINNEIININKLLDLIKTNNKNLLDHEFNTKCKSCKHNKLIHEEMGYLEEIETYENKILELKKSLDNIDYKTMISKLTQIIKNTELINKNIFERTKLNNKIEVENEKKIKKEKNEKIMILNEKYEEQINNKKQLYNENKTRYKEIQEIINIQKNIDILTKEYERNENLITKINKYENELLEMEKLINYKNEKKQQQQIVLEKIETYKNKIYLTKHEQKEEERIKKEIEENQKQYEILKTICELYYDSKEDYENKDDTVDKKKKTVKKTLKNIESSHIGIKTYMIRKKLKVLEVKINNLLKDITTYQITILLNKSELEFYKNLDKDKHLNIKRLSGYERTCINIAMRIVLNSMNAVMKNNFLIIDEGFGTCDDKNIHKIINLINMIKKDYEIVLLISHLNEIKNINGNNIIITQNETTKLSKIEIL